MNSYFIAAMSQKKLVDSTQVNLTGKLTEDFFKNSFSNWRSYFRSSLTSVLQSILKKDAVIPLYADSSTCREGIMSMISTYNNRMSVVEESGYHSLIYISAKGVLDKKSGDYIKNLSPGRYNYLLKYLNYTLDTSNINLLASDYGFTLIFRSHPLLSSIRVSVVLLLLRLLHKFPYDFIPETNFHSSENMSLLVAKYLMENIGDFIGSNDYGMGREGILCLAFFLVHIRYSSILIHRRESDMIFSGPQSYLESDNLKESDIYNVLFNFEKKYVDMFKSFDVSSINGAIKIIEKERKE